jgi:hypothetical protein
MKHPDDVARLREIKRLLERIQRLPRLAAMPIHGFVHGSANGPMNGLMNRLETSHHAGSGHGYRNGYAGGEADWDAGYRDDDAADDRVGPPHPTADMDLAPESARGPAGLPPLDPLPSAFDAGHDAGHGDSWRSDYWAADPVDHPLGHSRALVPVRSSAGGGLGISPWVFIAATAVNTVLAATLAVGITLGLARREAAPAETAKVAVVVKAAGQGQSDPAAPQPLELPPVGSASEPLRLEALKPTRLPFVVRPEEAAQDSYTLVLTGLPANATLSGAIKMGGGSWHLPPGALHGLEIVVPEWSTTVFEVGVELRRTNGMVAGRTKLWLAVPPPSAPTGASPDKAALKDMVRDGDKLLSRGDVVAARAMYERAAAMDSAPAALAMGTTYDQRRLWGLGVFGMVGNKERARHWYRRADELGHPDAKARLKALQ